MKPNQDVLSGSTLSLDLTLNEIQLQSLLLQLRSHCTDHKICGGDDYFIVCIESNHAVATANWFLDWIAFRAKHANKQVFGWQIGIKF